MSGARPNRWHDDCGASCWDFRNTLAVMKYTRRAGRGNQEVDVLRAALKSDPAFPGRARKATGCGCHSWRSDRRSVAEILDLPASIRAVVFIADRAMIRGRRAMNSVEQSGPRRFVQVPCASGEHVSFTFPPPRCAGCLTVEEIHRQQAVYSFLRSPHEIISNFVQAPESSKKSADFAIARARLRERTGNRPSPSRSHGRAFVFFDDGRPHRCADRGRQSSGPPL